VRYSLAIKVFLLALTLVATLSLKVIVRDTASSTNTAPWDHAVVAFLTDHQFQARSVLRSVGVRVIYAGSGDCRLVIRQLLPQAFNLDVIKSKSGEEGRLFFVYKGRIYMDPPLASIRLLHYWTRLEQKLGLETKFNLALAVASSESCSLDALPWLEIAESSSGQW
jgi:hypothetical protein